MTEKQEMNFKIRQPVTVGNQNGYILYHAKYEKDKHGVTVPTREAVLIGRKIILAEHSQIAPRLESHLETR
jgi:hypothetical protein